MRSHFLSFGISVVLLFVVQLHAADWPAFRGANGDGSSSEARAPVKWDNKTNVKWKTRLGAPGNSSPIVSNGRVFVTVSYDNGKTRSLICFDRKDGSQIWSRDVDYPKAMTTHKTNPHGSSTPVADGERVVVFHGSAGVYCYRFDGSELWHCELGEFVHIWGYASSPIIHEGQVFLNAGPGKRTAMTAMDLKTGKINWQTKEEISGDGSRRDDKAYTGTWASPMIRTIDGKEQLICSQTRRVVSYDPADGKVNWFCEGLKAKKGSLAYSSPMMAGDLCVQIGGFGGPGIGFKAGGSGDITANRAWRTERNPQSIGTGVYVSDHLFVPNAAGSMIRCIDPKTGRDKWNSGRDVAGKSWGSVVRVGGNLYVTNQTGDTVVFKPNPKKFELVSVNKLGERSNSTPAISDGDIFIRTFDSIYCISE